LLEFGKFANYYAQCKIKLHESFVPWCTSAINAFEAHMAQRAAKYHFLFCLAFDMLGSAYLACLATPMGVIGA
jgi:hypothetical protein